MSARWDTVIQVKTDTVFSPLGSYISEVFVNGILQLEDLDYIILKSQQSVKFEFTLDLQDVVTIKIDDKIRQKISNDLYRILSEENYEPR